MRLKHKLDDFVCVGSCARIPRTKRIAPGGSGITTRIVYPTSSIRNHTAKLYGYNVWKDLQLYVGGQPYSLEQIEHQVLRKMSEPRIHFAIVCASIGCPRLLNEAYVAEQVQQQLEANSQDFFSRPQNFRYDQRTSRFYLSSILSWFGEDFGSDQAAQLRTISQWLPSDVARQAAAQNKVSVSYLDYDWNQFFEQSAAVGICFPVGDYQPPNRVELR